MTDYYFIHIVYRIETECIDQSYYLVPVNVLKKHKILKKVNEVDGLDESLRKYFFNDPFVDNNNPILKEYMIENPDYDEGDETVEDELGKPFNINNGRIIKMFNWRVSCTSKK